MITSSQSFSLLQSRKFLCPTTKHASDVDVNSKKRNELGQWAKLCPSMDLILVQSTNSSSSLAIFRSLSWQKVAGVTLNESLGDKAEGDGSTTGSNNIPLSYCWSPNGQCIAVALESSIYLYGVENLVTVSGLGGGSGTISGSTNATWTIDLSGEQKGQGNSSGDGIDGSVSVSALHWVHVGKIHPTAGCLSVAEEEQEVSWRYQCHYIDQSTNFLPPSAYYSNDESAEGRGGSMGAADDPESSSLLHSSLPECRTPLSVLCVSTNDMEHRLYLHGRYPLLSLPKSKNDIAESVLFSSAKEKSITPPLVVASNDLAYWLTTTPINMNSSTVKIDTSLDSPSIRHFLTLYHTPFLKRDRYALQQIATLHTSIMAHLQTIQRSVSIVADSWKTSLRPLDQKLRPLTTLLRNYGVEVNLKTKDSNTNTMKSLSTVLKEYIMMGHVNQSSSIANAMDQFFTGVQMNDQLIQRMERSLLASMANVESTAIRCLLRPTQALGWQIQELGGLVQFFNTSESEEYNKGTRISRESDRNKIQLVHELTQAVEDLWISIENAMTSIVTGRMLVRDFCGWLRHAGSQVKARGTAPNSVQRENAKKRRITQSVLERLVEVFRNSGRREFSRRIDDTQQIGLSETLLDLKVSEMLKSIVGEGSKMSRSTGLENLPESPSLVKSILCNKPNVCQSLQRTLDATRSIFSNPLSNVPDQVISTEIFLPHVPKNERCKIAIHSRVGRDFKSQTFWDDEEEDIEEDRTYFQPKIANHSIHSTNVSPASGLENCRQWFLVAQAHENIVQLFCFPLGWKESDEDVNYMEYEMNKENMDISSIPFYLTSKLTLPAGGKILKVGFYGDDGKSSLSSGIDSGTGMERRQKFGFIYRKMSLTSSTLELWLTEYDSLSWQPVPFDTMLLDFSQVDENCNKDLLPISLDESPDEEDGILFAQCRRISEDPTAESCELLLCGSRGVGGVTVMSDGGVVSMNLLDLEDDEEEEEDDDEGSY